MKKNPGRKLRRQQERENMLDFRKKMKYANQSEKAKREPHPNAIKANELLESKIESAIEKVEALKNFFVEESPLGKEMLKDQELRLKRREQWKKEKGLA